VQWVLGLVHQSSTRRSLFRTRRSLFLARVTQSVRHLFSAAVHMFDLKAISWRKTNFSTRNRVEPAQIEITAQKKTLQDVDLRRLKSIFDRYCVSVKST